MCLIAKEKGYQEWATGRSRLSRLGHPREGELWLGCQGCLNSRFCFSPRHWVGEQLPLSPEGGEPTDISGHPEASDPVSSVASWHICTCCCPPLPHFLLLVRELNPESCPMDRPGVGLQGKWESGKLSGCGFVRMRLKGNTAAGQGAAKSGRGTPKQGCHWQQIGMQHTQLNLNFRWTANHFNIISMQYWGYTCTKKLFTVHLKFRFNWVFCILSGSPSWKRNEESILHCLVFVCETRWDRASVDSPPICCPTSAPLYGRSLKPNPFE